MEPKPGIAQTRAEELKHAASGMNFFHGWFDQIKPTGITADYYNNLAGIMMLTRLLVSSTERSVELTSYYRNELTAQLSTTRTYTEYWEQEASIANANAASEGKPLVDPLQVTAFFVHNIPSAYRLDEIAFELRSLEKRAENDEYLLESIIRRIAEARGIIYGQQDKDTLLNEFRLTKEDSQE